jgi:glutamate synthase domain-containing protein 1
MRDGKLGLYDPAFEHDSCGFGVIASIDGNASAWVVDQAFVTLARMSHRGGIGADGITGDGCGRARGESQRRQVAGIGDIIG